MVAESVLPRLRGAARSRRVDDALFEGDYVDEFDLAAHLESVGVGDAEARRRGVVDVFALAVAHLPKEAERPRRAALRTRVWADVRTGLGQSWLRAGVMAAGIALAFATTPTVDAARIGAIAGSLSWLAAQTTGGVAWAEINRGRSMAAGGTVGVLAALWLALGLIGAGYTASMTPLVWVSWGVANGICLPWAFSRRFIYPVLMAGVLIGALMVAGSPAVAVVAALLLVAVLLGVACRELIRRCGPIRLDRAVRTALLDSAAQAGGQVVVVLTAVALAPPEWVFPTVMAAVGASALSDPVLTVLDSGGRAASRRTTGWWALRTWTAANSVVGSSVAFGVGAGVLVAIGPARPDPQILALLAICTSTALAVGLWLRVGRGRGSAVGAMLVGLAAASLLVTRNLGLPLMVVLPTFALVVSVLAVASITWALSHPARW